MPDNPCGSLSLKIDSFTELTLFSAAAVSFSLAFNKTVSSTSGSSDTSPDWGSIPPLLDFHWQTGYSTCFVSLHKTGSNTSFLKTTYKPASSTSIRFFPSVPFGVSPSINVQGGSFWWHINLSSPISAFLPTAVCISFLSLLLQLVSNPSLRKLLFWIWRHLDVLLGK